MKKIILLPLTLLSSIPLFSSCGGNAVIDTNYVVNLIQTRNLQTQPDNFPGVVVGGDKLKSTLDWFKNNMRLVENDLIFDCFQFIDFIGDETIKLTFDNYYKLSDNDTIISLWKTKKMNVNIKPSGFAYEFNSTNDGWNIKQLALILNFQFTGNYPNNENPDYKTGEVLSFTYWLTNCSITYRIDDTTNILEHQVRFIGSSPEKIYGIFERPTDALKLINNIYPNKSTNYYKYQ